MHIQTARSHSYRRHIFLERFRYTIIGSHLVDEYDGPGPPGSLSDLTQPARHFDNPVTGLTGALLTALAAFLLVFVIKFVQDLGSLVGRLWVSLACLALYTSLYLVFRTFLHLQHARGQALITASTLVTDLQNFERASTATLSLIQEVELVSKGYRTSSPLTSVSRVDDARASRRCVTLRRQLAKSLVDGIISLGEAIAAVRPQVGEDDLGRYLDIYDIPRQACYDALSNSTHVGGVAHTEHESIGCLRLLSYKRSLLRRYFLCSLLAIGNADDIADPKQWQLATAQMSLVARDTASHVQDLSSSISELSSFVDPPSPMPTSGAAPDRIRAQLRQLGTLSQGMRSLHVKMALMREESDRSIEQNSHLTDLGPLLINQYEAIGVELQSVLQDWQAGRAAFLSGTEVPERCISRGPGSPSFLSPTTSLGGLTAVSDYESFSIDSNLAAPSSQGGGPAEALRALNGGADAQSDVSSGEHEQVFEGIALPRKRASMFQPGMSRAERIARQTEERTRQVQAREKRVSGTSMIRELQSVINLRRTSMPASAASRPAMAPGPLSATTDLPPAHTDETPFDSPRSPHDHAGVMAAAAAQAMKKRRATSIHAKPFAGLDVHIS